MIPLRFGGGGVPASRWRIMAMHLAVVGEIVRAGFVGNKSHWARSYLWLIIRFSISVAVKYPAPLFPVFAGLVAAVLFGLQCSLSFIIVLFYVGVEFAVSCWAVFCCDLGWRLRRFRFSALLPQSTLQDSRFRLPMMLQKGSLWPWPCLSS